MDAVVKRQPFEQVAESVKTTIVLLREKNLTVNEIAAHPDVIGHASPTFVRTYLAQGGYV